MGLILKKSINNLSGYESAAEGSVHLDVGMVDSSISIYSCRSQGWPLGTPTEMNAGEITGSWLGLQPPAPFVLIGRPFVVSHLNHLVHHVIRRCDPFL
jgi:hypothetical protein